MAVVAKERSVVKKFWLKFVSASIVTAILIQIGFAASGGRYAIDMWLTRDQQGLWYFRQGKYLLAARRFEDPAWKAYAYYRAEQFDTAQKLFAQRYDQRAFFNRGNSMAHLGRYEKARDFYRMALALEFKFPEALENLKLMEVLAKNVKYKPEYDGDGNTSFEADDVVLDLEKEERTHLSDNINNARHELWLQSLDSTPADFLRLKFHYQHHVNPGREQ
jgi:Ca-activated chloride channel family protein